MFELSNEEKAEIRKTAIANFELNFFEARFFEKLNNLFHWEGDIEFPEMFESLIRIYGSIGYSKNQKKWVVGYTNGQTDELNRPIIYNAHDLTTHKTSSNYEIGSDVILCWNNSLRLSDAPIINHYCDLLTEGEKSLKCQLINSRNIPILAVTDDNMKDQLTNVFKKAYSGIPFIAVTDLMQDVKPIDILDPTMVDKLQYLTSFSEEIKKRLYGEFGIEIKNEDKRAQVSVEELKKEEDLITLNYLSYYESRLKFVEEMKNAGINISVTPSPIYITEPNEEEIKDPEAYKEELTEKMEEAEPAKEVSNESGKEGETDEKNED